MRKKLFVGVITAWRRDTAGNYEGNTSPILRIALTAAEANGVALDAMTKRFPSSLGYAYNVDSSEVSIEDIGAIAELLNQ